VLINAKVKEKIEEINKINESGLTNNNLEQCLIQAESEIRNHIKVTKTITTKITYTNL